jgi:hypothetical protein
MENYFVISFGQLEETKYAYMNLVWSVLCILVLLIS